ncbi:MAG: flavin reductase family protein [Veillonellaceae bacterium]|nr:flavin reductase family protein [Veillonellaceae bacterium]
MKEVTYNEYADKALEILSNGAFLTTAHDGKVNTMTIGWGSVSYIWGKPVMMVMVRESRYTHDLIEKSGEFTVSLPFKDMKKKLNFCGAKSGREVDKIAVTELTTAPGQKVSTPVIADCGLTYECKIVYKQVMDEAGLDPEYKQKWYAQGDYHTLYYGEIVACYTNDK